MDVLTAVVVAVNGAVVAPEGTVTLVGIVTADDWLLAKVTIAPPLGAAAVSVMVPVDEVPPVTVAGLNETDANDATAGADCGVKRRTDENGPKVPAELRARTRHHNRCDGRPLSVTWDAVTLTFATNGELIVDELSTWTS